MNAAVRERVSVETLFSASEERSDAQRHIYRAPRDVARCTASPSLHAPALHKHSASETLRMFIASRFRMCEGSADFKDPKAISQQHSFNTDMKSGVGVEMGSGRVGRGSEKKGNWEKTRGSVRA